MFTDKSYRFARKLSMTAAACTLAAVTLAAVLDGAVAEPVAISPAGLQPGVMDLERAFWVCDYVATTEGLSATPVDACGAVTEKLKNAKFGGDFDAMVTWWRQNKPAAHEAIARATP